MLRCSGGTTAPGREMTRSPTRISPASGAMNPAISRSVVVLPHPEGPSNETNSPGSMRTVDGVHRHDVAEALGESGEPDAAGHSFVPPRKFTPTIR